MKTLTKQPEEHTKTLSHMRNGETILQTKLKHSSRGDKYEQEADRTAGEVTNLDTDYTFKRDTPPISNLDQLSALPQNTKGRPLDRDTRDYMESGFGYNFSNVRIHTDEPAVRLNSELGSKAVTTGQNIYFGRGEYMPRSPQGSLLLAHELTHVTQQEENQKTPHPDTGVQPFIGRVVRSIGRGVRRAGRAVGRAVRGATRAVGGFVRRAGETLGRIGRGVGRALTAAGQWIAERLRGAARWVVNLIIDMPARLQRLAVTLWEGLRGVITFLPEAIQALASGGIRGFANWLWERAKRGGAWVLTLLSRAFDLFGGPEIIEFLWHIFTNARPLTDPERRAGQRVLGDNAIRWNDVRVSQGGLLNLIFRFNDARAFVMFHTVNFPPGTAMEVMVHELVHVKQYETAGSQYLGQAIHAQVTEGDQAYNYGGVEGLEAAREAGRRFRDFNREQQGQIAQDYYREVIEGNREPDDPVTLAYQPYIDDLRRGEL